MSAARRRGGARRGEQPRAKRPETQRPWWSRVLLALVALLVARYVLRAFSSSAGRGGDAYSGSIVRVDGELALVLALPTLEEPEHVSLLAGGTRVIRSSKRLALADPLFELVRTHRSLSRHEVCHTFALALLARACASGDVTRPLARLEMDDDADEMYRRLFAAPPPRAGSEYLVDLNLAGVGHQLIMHVLHTSVGVRARLLQAHVVADDAPEPSGFSALDWLSGGRFAKAIGPGCRWLDADALKAYARRLVRLRSLVLRLAESDLLDCARAAGKMSRSAQRRWAAEKVETLGDSTLIMQPVWSTLDEYARIVRAEGLPVHVNIYALNGRRDVQPEQLLDFPLEQARPIMRLYRELFGADAMPHAFLRAVEWYGEPGAWEASVHALKPELSSRALHKLPPREQQSQQQQPPRARPSDGS